MITRILVVLVTCGGQEVGVHVNEEKDGGDGGAVKEEKGLQ